MLRRLIGEDVEFSTRLDGAAGRVRVDPAQLDQLIMNLTVNARDAMPSGGTLVISTASVAVEDTSETPVAGMPAGSYALIEVSDTGIGIGPEIRSHIFEPFFTTKPVGAGTGIGLGVSRGIVEAHGGTLTLAPTDRGACFVVRLPLRAANHAPVEAAPAEPDTPSDKRSVLVIDDEAEVGRLLSEMLSTQGFRCDVVGSGAAARLLLEQRDYDAILCDVRMPDVDGPALFAWAREHRPHLCARIAFVTGDTLGAAAGGFLAYAGRPILEKPFVPAELRRLMTELMPAPG
jgi:two-component system NtrC family sensor kinase